MIIKQVRQYRDTYTLSELDVDSVLFCWVLEPVGRPWGVKIPGKTCIPEGSYNVDITVSNRWGKPMMILSNKRDKTIERAGVTFTGIRPHGGNTVDDTEGCPLVAYNSDNCGKIWARASDDLLVMVRKAKDNSEPVIWVINSDG